MAKRLVHLDQDVPLEVSRGGRLTHPTPTPRHAARNVCGALLKSSAGSWEGEQGEGAALDRLPFTHLFAALLMIRTGTRSAG